MRITVLPRREERIYRSLHFHLLLCAESGIGCQYSPNDRSHLFWECSLGIILAMASDLADQPPFSSVTLDLVFYPVISSLCLSVSPWPRYFGVVNYLRALYLLPSEHDRALCYLGTPGFGAFSTVIFHTHTSTSMPLRIFYSGMHIYIPV